MTTQNPAQDVSDQYLGAAFREAKQLSAERAPQYQVAYNWIEDRARELQQAQSGALLEDTLEWIHNSPDLTKENFSKATAELQQAQVVGEDVVRRAAAEYQRVAVSAGLTFTPDPDIDALHILCMAAALMEARRK